MKDAKTRLIAILQKAHAGERAAALAYSGHWKALKNPAEVSAVRQIEAEEWLHRRQLAEMMKDFQVKPRFLREIVFFIIGKTISLICRVCGRFCATFFAGILENANVCEYGLASEYAENLGLPELVEELRVMEKTEADHEDILREMIAEHPFLPLFSFVFRWGNPAKQLPARCSVKTENEVDLNI